MLVLSSDYTEVIPGLFIGSYKVASDWDTLSSLGIKAVVNVCQLEPCFTDKIKVLHRDVKDCYESGALKDSKGRYWAEECAEFIEENLDIASSSEKNLRSSEGEITKYALTFDGDKSIPPSEEPVLSDKVEGILVEMEDLLKKGSKKSSSMKGTIKSSSGDSKRKPFSSVLVHCRYGVSRSAACILYYLMTRRRMTLKDAYTFLRGKRSIISPNIGFMTYFSSIDEGKTFTVKEYSLEALSRSFPTVDKKEIETRYNLALTMKKSEYDALSEKGYEPYGYHAVDLLLADFPDAFQELPSRTVHEPFE